MVSVCHLALYFANKQADIHPFELEESCLKYFNHTEEDIVRLLDLSTQKKLCSGRTELLTYTEGGNRTPTLSPEKDFESFVSTDFTTSAKVDKYLEILVATVKWTNESIATIKSLKTMNIRQRIEFTYSLLDR